MPAKLFLLSGGEVEPEPPFVISEDARIVVGRGNEADVVLLDREVSREHFHISHDGRAFILEDLGSVNGTLVNGERVQQPLALRDGDTIQAGAIQLRFALGAGAEREGAGAAAAAAPAAPAAQAEVVRVQLSPVEGAAGGAARRPRLSLLAFRWWKLPLYPALIPVAMALGILLYPVRAWRRGRQARALATTHPDHTVRNFLQKHPRDSANQVWRWWQSLWYWLILLGLLVLFLWHPVRFLHVFHVFCSFYLIVIAYKLAAVLLSVVKRGEIVVTAAEVAALKDDELPVYTILVPLYHEKEVASKITRYIARLDYPQDKLDVKLLLEEDDAETLAVCQRANLPPNYEMIVCPDCLPKTKPKACNHGLERARGEYLVIYDAEDRPEPDQLKKAVVAFQRVNRPRRGLARLFGRRETVCLQAKLNYYNPTQNLLTKWFTIEYSTWFDLFLPGLHRLGSPIPLGGTSNHFRTRVLEHIGGWDPFNVTEDCDLGIRLDKMGYKTRVLDSTTWEEANSRLWNWVRQRSRWVKGYIQTHLVHMRNPLASLWRLGPVGMFGFLASVGGLSLMLLLNPFFWLIILFYGACWAHDLSLSGWNWGATLAFQDTFEPGRWPWDRWLDLDGPWVWRMWYDNPRGDPFWNTWSQVFYVITVVLFLANFFFVFMHIWACIRRKLLHLIPHAILTPFYWILISFGAWKGFIQLLHNPFKWEKTHHGLDAPGAAAPPLPVVAHGPPATPT